MEAEGENERLNVLLAQKEKDISELKKVCSIKTVYLNMKCIRSVLYTYHHITCPHACAHSSAYLYIHVHNHARVHTYMQT